MMGGSRSNDCTELNSVLMVVAVSPRHVPYDERPKTRRLNPSGCGRETSRIISIEVFSTLAPYTLLSHWSRDVGLLLSFLSLTYRYEQLDVGAMEAEYQDHAPGSLGRETTLSVSIGMTRAEQI